MKENNILMIIIAFIFGFTISNSINNICRLVEGEEINKENNFGCIKGDECNVVKDGKTLDNPTESLNDSIKYCLNCSTTNDKLVCGCCLEDPIEVERSLGDMKTDNDKPIIVDLKEKCIIPEPSYNVPGHWNEDRTQPFPTNLPEKSKQVYYDPWSKSNQSSSEISIPKCDSFIKEPVFYNKSGKIEAKCEMTDGWAALIGLSLLFIIIGSITRSVFCGFNLWSCIDKKKAPDGTPELTVEAADTKIYKDPRKYKKY